TCIDNATLDRLPQPSQVGRTRVGGVDINKPRTRAVIEAVIALSPAPAGFSISALAARVGEITGLPYHSRQAPYDLKKRHGKGLLRRVEHTRKWEATPRGLSTMAGLVILREKVIKPVLAGIVKPHTGRRSKLHDPDASPYQAIQREMYTLFQILRTAV